jgi:hypothetical protein
MNHRLDDGPNVSGTVNNGPLTVDDIGPIRTISRFIRARPKGLLHHYTTSGGLIGIFESRTIWATSAYHLNDSEEFVHASRLLRDELSKRIEEATGPRKETFAQWLEGFRPDEKEQAFIASFSERGNLLSQWRSYTRCDDAYSIAFDREEIQEILESPDCLLARIIREV